MTKKFYNTEDVERLAMANCAMILNRAQSRVSEPGRIFECRVCHRNFATFQALGGHAASHRRPKLGHGDTETEKQQLLIKAHKCIICKQEFWTGQALGGHMRRHRSPKISFLGTDESNNNTNSSTVTSTSDDHSEDFKVISNNNCDGERIFGLDLNLSPEENESAILEF